MKFLSQVEAAKIDEQLLDITKYGYLNEQLMELAGLAVAESVQKSFASASKVLAICGPGNNGGDGLVCARHLFHFGKQVVVLVPKKPSKTTDMFNRLYKQVESLGITVLYQVPENLPTFLASYELIVDAIFGYSFTGDIRAPFNLVIAAMAKTIVPVLSVDIPSGWNVEQGDIANTGFVPAVLVSLTAPKKCAEKFSGVHYVGGRFVPPLMEQEMDLQLPKYTGTEQTVLVSKM